MLCTDRFLFLLGVPLFLAVLSIAWPPALWLFVAADAALLALLLADYVSARLARRTISVERELGISLSCGTPQPLKLIVGSRARRRVRLGLREVLPPEVEIKEPIIDVTLPALSRTTITNVITPKRRGTLNFTALHLRATGRLGLVRTQWRLPLPASIVVMPNLAAITELERIFTFGAHEGQTIRRSDYSAEGFAFERLTDFVHGDDSRHLDWKATAKRHKLTVRRYEIERSQRVILALDCGRLMGSEINGTRRIDLAVNAAVLLAHVASLKDDFVGLIAFAQDVLAFLPPKKGRSHFRAIVRCLAGLEPQRVESDYALAFSWLQQRVRHRSLVVIMSDLIDPDASSHLIDSVVGLRRRHLPLCVSIRDAALEGTATATPLRPLDVYTSLAARALLKDSDRATTILRSNGCLAREALPGQISSALLQSYFAVKKQNLL